MALNLFDVEDSWMQGAVDFGKVIAEFEVEYMAPKIETMLGLDMWLNQDIYLGGVEDDGETSEILRQEPPATPGIRNAPALGMA